jgi:hypothetical protein
VSVAVAVDVRVIVSGRKTVCLESGPAAELVVVGEFITT